MTVNDRVTAYRRRMRERGLRPVQTWVPDVRNPVFAEQAHRQSVVVASLDESGDDQDFVDAITEDWDRE